MNHTQILVGGSLVLTGKNGKGETIEVLADVKNIELETSIPEQLYYSINTNRKVNIAPNRDITTLKAEFVGPYRFNVISGKVKRTARVLGWEDPDNAEKTGPTISRIQEAADKAGVDVNTDFDLVIERDIVRRCRQVWVEFTWSE